MGITEVMYAYGLSVFSIVLIFLITYLQLKISKSDLRQWCILIITCAIITNISTMFQIVSISNVRTWVTFEGLSFIGLTFMPVCVYMAIASFLNENFDTNKKYLFLFVIPIFSVLATMTNGYHHLMFRRFSTNYMECKYGFLFVIMIVNLYVTYLLSLFLLFRNMLEKIEKNKTQIITSLILIILPMIIQFLGIIKVVECETYINGIIQSLFAIITIEILLKYQFLMQLPVSLDVLLDSISDGYVVIDSKFKIINYNKNFLKMFNLGKLNIKGMNFGELADYKEFDTLDENDLNKFIKVKNRKIIIERKSETLGLTFKYEVSPLAYKNKNLVLIYVTDITQHAIDVQNIKMNQEAILGRERLASLGQMIGGIAHNLKTPIFSISGAVEGLEDLTKEYKESISDSTVTIDDHKEIVRDMLEWTGKIKGYLSYMTDMISAIQMQTANNSNSIQEKFTVEELIKFINVLMKYELKRNLIEFNINCRIDAKKEINGNINCLIQVLNNLISNSIQAYESSKKEKIIDLNMYEQEDKIIIEVIDYAEGIPDHVKDKLFKEMVTTKGKNGTGLGLFISYTNIKTGFGGNLLFNTQKGEGTTFKIVIPNN